MRNRTAIAMLVAVSGALPARPAIAQIQEVMVTVRKREESLQEVPISVNVLSAEQIERRGISSLDDLARQTPGVILDAGFYPQDQRIVIRGLSPSRGRPNVAVLQDGIDISSEAITTAGGSLLVNPRLVDIEQIAVVKGPQSALYGRSAFAGAINYVTRQPGNEFDARVKAEIGSNGHYDASASVSGPVNGETVLMGLNAAWWSEDGFYRNALSGGEVGGADGAGVAGTAVFNISEGIKFRARAEYTDDHFQPPAQATVIPVTTRPVPGIAVGTVISPVVTEILVPLGRPPRASAITLAQSEDPRTGRDYPGTDRRVFRISVIGDIELGPGEFTTLSHSAHAVTSQSFDGQRKRSITATPPPTAGTNNFAEVNLDIDTELFSQELRYRWGGDVFNWTVGGLFWYEHARANDFSLTCFVQPSRSCEDFVAAIGTTEPANPRRWDRVTDHWSVYGMAEWEVNPAWKLTVEARYADEKTTVAGPDSPAIIDPFFLLQVGVAVPAPAGFNSGAVSDAYLVPKVTLEWRPMHDVMLYASIGEGIKPAGLSTVTGGASEFQPDAFDFEAEKMWSYEVGTKTAWLDKRLTVNAGVFYQDYTDKQGTRQVLLDSGLLGIGPINAGAATALGFELETIWMPVENLTLSVNYTWLQTEYQDFTQVTTGASQIARAGNCELVPDDNRPLRTACRIDLSGNELEGAPKHALLAGITHLEPFSDHLKWLTEVSAQYQSERYQSEFNDLQFAPYWLFDLRLGLIAEQWEVVGYVANLLDDDTIKSGFVAPDFDSFNFISSPGPSTFITSNMAFYNLPDPRQVGVRASFRF